MNNMGPANPDVSNAVVAIFDTFDREIQRAKHEGRPMNGRDGIIVLANVVSAFLITYETEAERMRMAALFDQTLLDTIHYHEKLRGCRRQ